MIVSAFNLTMGIKGLKGAKKKINFLELNLRVSEQCTKKLRVSQNFSDSRLMTDEQ
jgi:hypothetical protein